MTPRLALETTGGKALDSKAHAVESVDLKPYPVGNGVGSVEPFYSLGTGSMEGARGRAGH